ncbi:MAG: hypothetical protein PWR16_387 [Methanoculleus sp.]|nr:hypothetical protein [Methanoculleus sp.]
MISFVQVIARGSAASRMKRRLTAGSPHGLHDEPITLEPPPKHHGDAVAVDGHAPVLFRPCIPTRNPVSLPGNHLLSCDELVLLEPAGAPEAVYDPLAVRPASCLHLGRPRTHAARFHPARPGPVRVEPGKRPGFRSGFQHRGLPPGSRSRRCFSLGHSHLRPETGTPAHIEICPDRHAAGTDFSSSSSSLLKEIYGMRSATATTKHLAP